MAEFYLVRSETTGRHLEATSVGALSTCPHTGDRCIWTVTGDPAVPSAIRNAVTGRVLHAVPAHPARKAVVAGLPEGPAFTLHTPEGVALGEDGKGVVTEGARNPAVFTALAGPVRLPSDYLAELREKGYTVLDSVLQPNMIQTIKEVFARVRADLFADQATHDGNFWMMNTLASTPAVSAAACHPVAIWIMQQYMGVKRLHFFHQPIVNTLKPANKLLNRTPPGGWHSDYPYRQGRFIGDRWPSGEVMRLGVQFNICVDEFRADNAATQFVPGSHLAGCEPPPALNEGGTVMGQGAHKDAIQIPAPAGAALLYDSRTWHRACHELNVSGADRVGILNAVGPSWIVPMMDKTREAQAYRDSPIPQLLDPRLAKDIDRMCCTELDMLRSTHPAAKL